MRKHDQQCIMTQSISKQQLQDCLRCVRSGVFYLRRCKTDIDRLAGLPEFRHVMEADCVFGVWGSTWFTMCQNIGCVFPVCIIAGGKAGNEGQVNSIVMLIASVIYRHYFFTVCCNVGRVNFYLQLLE
jgi:hypothetical protein